MTKKRCFVISPIGKKGTEIRGHADDVFKFIIQPAMMKFKEQFDIEIDAIRANHVDQMGAITPQTFEEILGADLCVAILTGHNPNVFYELAVAQASARPVIILIERGQSLPFDVKDLRCVLYQLQPVTHLMEGVYSNEVFEKIRNIFEDGWDAIGLFHQYGFGRQLGYEKILQSLIKTARPNPLPVGWDMIYALPSDSNRQIVLVTGDIKEVRDFKADVIVSLETTDLQLARYCDPWLSGTLRYLDAKKTPGGSILEDSLNEELQKQIKNIGIAPPFVPGSTVATPTNQLAHQGFKYVFHVAAMQGAVGDGYHTMDVLLDDCIRNVFRQFAEMSKNHSELQSILFPMLGAASTGLGYVELSKRILEAVIHGMKVVPSCQKTYVLAWIDPHLYALRKAANQLGLKELSSA